MTPMRFIRDMCLLSGLLALGGPAHAAQDSALLGPVFESKSAGIMMRGPAGAEVIRKQGADEVVQFVNDDRKWFLTVTRAQLTTPRTLDTQRVDGKEVPGLLDATVRQLQIDKPGAMILRNDFITIGDVPTGMIAARYTLGTETYLMQQAILRVTDKHYIYVTFIALAPRGGELEDDPNTRAAVATFSAVLDSIRLMDQSAVREDQAQRLFRTRALLIGWNEPKLRSVLVPAQWLRIIRDGKDIGYTYVVEEVARDLPRKNAQAERQAGAEGVLIGTRTRTLKDGTQVDSETWMFVTFDRKHESWSTVGLISDPTRGRRHVNELGVSTRRMKAIPDKGSVLEGNKGVELTEEYVLDVTRIGRSADAEPVHRDLPPFYLPQALEHLLPRLLPRNQSKTYMFASYVSDKGEVMSRYVDVGREQMVSLGGQSVRAIPIQDRIGLEGSVTTHYVGADGRYLGSVNRDSKLTVLPTDAATLEQIWKDANLTRPGDVEEK